MSKKRESKIYPEYYPYAIPFDPSVGMDVFKEIDEAPAIEDVDEDFKKANCYKGEIKIMNRDIEFPYTPEQEAEFEKCMNDVIYFIVNYCKVITLSDGLQLLKLYQYQKNSIKIIHENRFSIFKFSRQMGKPLIHNTLLLTPNGFKKIADIKTGEYVYGDDGKPTKVIFKTEPQYVKCYKITFDNGEEIVAGANHDWKYIHPDVSDYVIDTTESMFEVFNSKHKNSPDFHIELSNYIDFEYQNAEINPLRIIKEKHIPHENIYNSKDMRIALLQSLMDAIGHVTNGVCSIYQDSNGKQLIKEFRFLLSTLGIKSHIYNLENNAQRIEFRCFDYPIFSMEHKVRQQYMNVETGLDDFANFIKDIVEVPTEPSYCISVDNESHLFLCGETLIPTHNCTVSKTDITIRINGEEMDLTIGQLYDLIDQDNIVESYTPNEDYQILTQDGFKDFDGITTRSVDEIYQITLSNETIIRATAKHEIRLFDTKFVQLKDLKVGDIVGVDDQNTVTKIEVFNGDFRVADMISVRDTHSFAVNDLSAIMSNCIDGDSMVTLLDNHTGKIFQIHISKLFDYLYAGSK